MSKGAWGDVARQVANAPHDRATIRRLCATPTRPYAGWPRFTERLRGTQSRLKPVRHTLRTINGAILRKLCMTAFRDSLCFNRFGFT